LPIPKRLRNSGAFSNRPKLPRRHRALYPKREKIPKTAFDEPNVFAQIINVQNIKNAFNVGSVGVISLTPSAPTVFPQKPYPLKKSDKR
jgi:hypothetical protein